MNVIATGRPSKPFGNGTLRPRHLLGTWYEIVSKGDWSGPADLKRAFGNNVDFVADNRAIFDIGGNKYSLVVHFSYMFKTALIKFVGTHDECDGINAETV